MKAIAGLLFVAAGVAYGQTPPKLGPAEAVDIHVRSVEWHPGGTALVYSRDEANGIGIGIYRPGDPEGKVVLHLSKDDAWNCDWFPGSTSALVTVHKKISAAGVAKNEADVYLLDGKQQTSYLVFSKAVPQPEDIAVDCDLSPSLNHAICTVTEGKTTYHEVLPVNGGRMLPSTDIDQAVAQGFSGPTWSVDGTAIYGKGGQGLSINGANVTLSNAQDPESAITLTIKAQSATLDGRSFVLKFAPPEPPAGTPVLEVVPSNGVLRQVRSPGPWVDQPGSSPRFATVTGANWLSLQQLRGQAHSLWLIVRKPNPEPAPNADNPTVVVVNGIFRVGSGSQEQTVGPDTVGALVAAQADSGEIAPGEKSVSYLTDGVLFVRAIEG
ncbi:MAG TPA: hypothetical protein VMI31_10955 [Fimbriimonadaceae bacterium]|nr:hypothetical protein [Fimbriimonadaceae bacterium]